MNKYIYAHDPLSASAKALCIATGYQRIKHDNSKFHGRHDRLVFNWGASRLPPEVGACPIVNSAFAVSATSNKASFFKNMKDLNITPPFTFDKDEAIGWVNQGGFVVCRTILNGHGGAGIVMARVEEEVVDAPLYVEYKKKSDEYRIHVFSNTIIDIQQKARRLEVPDKDVNWQVRNHANGFIYRRQDVKPPQSVLDIALKCMAATDLDFGAVDIIYNNHEERPYVLEVNSAPGLEGQTIESYANAFRNF